MLLLLLNDQNYCLSFLLCKKNVAKTLNLPIEDVNIKATTEERLGLQVVKKVFHLMLFVALIN